MLHKGQIVTAADDPSRGLCAHSVFEGLWLAACHAISQDDLR